MSVETVQPGIDAVVIETTAAGGSRRTDRVRASDPTSRTPRRRRASATRESRGPPTGRSAPPPRRARAGAGNAAVDRPYQSSPFPLWSLGVSSPRRQPRLHRRHVRLTKTPDFRAVLEARQPAGAGPETDRPIAHAESHRHRVHGQDAFAVSGERLHVTSRDPVEGRAQLSPAGHRRRVLKRASKHAVCSTKGT